MIIYFCMQIKAKLEINIYTEGERRVGWMSGWMIGCLDELMNGQTKDGWMDANWGQV